MSIAIPVLVMGAVLIGSAQPARPAGLQQQSKDVEAADSNQQADTITTSVDLSLEVGGRASGLVVDFNDEAIVFVSDGTPQVLAWDEIDPGSAFVAMRDLLAMRRGGADRLQADDFIHLGKFCLNNGRTDLATRSFRQASDLDPGVEPHVRALLDAYRDERENAGSRASPIPVPALDEPESGEPSIAADGEGEAPGRFPEIEFADKDQHSRAISPEDRRRILTAYRKFGESVQKALGRDVRLVETEHFLIWTDWEPPSHPRLASWCEAMYAALCAQLDFDPHENVFPAKCPVFCWRSRVMLKRFARLFDDYDAGDALGYTRSIPGKGHVHVVIARQGQTQRAYDRFAWTLVHEGTHAFMHHYHSDRLIPHWINEGLAELIAQRVLGRRCPAAAKADLLARQYARYDWSLGGMLKNAGPIEVHQYPLVHSVVAFLESRGRRSLSDLVRALKEGRTIAESLAESYSGWTIGDLESAWRSAVRDGWAVPRE
ncbi:MAG: hypothetical protein J5J06_16645 [Phycisphaerae bacterium]|nr:hypothetical protein [Phycisphaerae bacterium]